MTLEGSSGSSSSSSSSRHSSSRRSRQSSRQSSSLSNSASNDNLTAAIIGYVPDLEPLAQEGAAGNRFYGGMSDANARKSLLSGTPVDEEYPSPEPPSTPLWYVE